MIKSLRIENFVLIESLEIRFSKGLTIITGETGAGKSILLGALGLIMGKRADTKTLYDENKKCIIEGIFHIGMYDLHDFFEQHDIDYDQELIIRREITPSGKSRAFVNDTPTNLKVLQSLSASLIDLHQQFDTLDINDNSFQLQMIDALADNKALVSDYQSRFKAYQADKRILADLIERNQNAAKELDFIRFQLNELEAAELQENEQEKLEEELNRLSNAEAIAQTLSGAYQQLNENEMATISQLEEIGQSLNQISKFDAELKDLYTRFNSILLELQDLSSDFERLAEDIEFDPQRTQEVQERLDLLYRLQKKHGVNTVAELLDIQQDLSERQHAFDNLSVEIEALDKDIQLMEKELWKQAEQLRERRQQVFSSFEEKVKALLAELSMTHAVLKVHLSPMDKLGSAGADDVRFLFAANKGGRLQQIKEVASGGELSRLALVTKSLVASAIPLPTLIFDEIDSGISGDVALKMGNILRKLSDEHQVISITHSPQVASKADKHYFAYKSIKDERTITQLKLLKDEERVHSIATMLSQDPPSNSAIENARELLQHR
jgi:DNA repair protein RecN (Recombination protein N)